MHALHNNRPNVSEMRRSLQAKDPYDISPCVWICGGGQRNQRHAREMIAQFSQGRVFRTEIVTPMRDAVRFIDGKQGDRHLLEQCQRTVLNQAFRRDVEQV